MPYTDCQETAVVQRSSFESRAGDARRHICTARAMSSLSFPRRNCSVEAFCWGIAQLGRPMGFQHQQPVVAQQQPSYNPTAQPYVVPQPQPPRQVPGWPAPPPRQTTPGFGTQTTGGVQLVTPAREYRQPPPPQQPAVPLAQASLTFAALHSSKSAPKVL